MERRWWGWGVCRLYVWVLFFSLARCLGKILYLQRRKSEWHGRSKRTLLGIAILIMYLILTLRHVLVWERSSRGRRKIREGATCNRGRCSSCRSCRRRRTGTRSLCTHIITCSLGVGIRVMGSRCRCRLTCIIRWIVWWNRCSFSWMYLSVDRLLSELTRRWWWELVIVGIVGTA